MSIQISDDGKSRVISDSYNPRIWVEEFKCVGCGEWFDKEEVNWALPDGTLDVDKGSPYCDSCLPEGELNS